MAQVPFAELRSALHAVLARAEGGEELTITVDGAPVAVLGPVTDRRRWMPRDEFVEMVLRHQADPALGEVLTELNGYEPTDDLPFL